jgi:HSP20 family protein
MLARAERLHREFFRLASPAARLPAWEPPVDILETEGAVLVLVALPGVNPECVEASIDGSDLVFSGDRVFPAEMRTAIIHRLELPQGRFERRVRLPAGRYSAIQRSASEPTQIRCHACSQESLFLFTKPSGKLACFACPAARR